jgi:hypothetical protein
LQLDFFTQFNFPCLDALRCREKVAVQQRINLIFTVEQNIRGILANGNGSGFVQDWPHDTPDKSVS